MKAKYLNPKTESDVYDKVTDFFCTAVATVLHDKHGEDKETIHKTIRQITDLVDSMNRGYVSLDDLKQTLAEEAGVVIT